MCRIKSTLSWHSHFFPPRHLKNKFSLTRSFTSLITFKYTISSSSRVAHTGCCWCSQTSLRNCSHEIIAFVSEVTCCVAFAGGREWFRAFFWGELGRLSLVWWDSRSGLMFKIESRHGHFENSLNYLDFAAESVPTKRNFAEEIPLTVQSPSQCPSLQSPRIKTILLNFP